MKKTLLIPAVALLFLGACSSDDEAVRPVPNDPVQTVPSVADHVTLNAPAQKEVKAEGSLYRVFYENGQEIVYTFGSDVVEGSVAVPIAIVNRVEGSASDVVIPASVTYGDKTLIVYSINLYMDSFASNVKSLTIPNTAVAMPTGYAYSAVTADHLRTQLSIASSLQKINIEDGLKGFCSINGAIYTDDLTTLVGVPRAYPGTFTVADATEKLDPRALFYCTEIDVLTIPASVKEIGDEAVTFNKNLLLINCQAVEAPIATSDAFGTFAHNGVLRIPAGAEANYKFTKPDVRRPKEPVEPDEEATQEELDAYEEALAQYEAELAEYQEVIDNWTNHEGWAGFKNIEGVNFNK